MIKVIIADDHQMFIDGIRSLLKQAKNISVVGQAHNGVELLELLKSTPADLILMDVSMPDMNGIEATKQVRALYPSTRIMMLTMHSTADYIEKLLKAGANGYILKNTGQQELITAIGLIASGESYYSKEVTQRIMEGLQGKQKPHDPMQAELTEREKEVLKLIAQEMTTPEIAEKLFLSTHTVETHRKNLISKLGVKNIAGLVKYAIQQGIVE